MLITQFIDISLPSGGYLMAKCGYVIVVSLYCSLPFQLLLHAHAFLIIFLNIFVFGAQVVYILISRYL